MIYDVEKNIERLKMLILVAIITLIGQKIGYGISLIDALPGIIIIIVLSMVGLTLKEILPFKLPAFAYVCLIALILTMPYLPTSKFILKYTNQINFLGTTTPILAYAGISIGLSITKLAKISWKLIVIACFVFLATFFGSAIVAQIVLKIQGII
ncbi:MAG: Uncharacterized protein XE09_0038 [Atribacteria bacterium 34_868]|nr:MAG: Uncharacterized protein XE09_0038 [Atribacteria bacterium 34_868]HAJ33177.1 hypothetical protein [Candidatus Atribacteria bacterium]